MKFQPGDLVSIKPEQQAGLFYYGYGVVTLIEDYGRSGIWCRVQWSEETLWHRPGDLDLVNEVEK